MDRFIDREDAGKRLADELEKREFHDKKDCVVVALPRGGVPVAYPIAKRLGVPLDIVVPRKIGAPGHKEYAIGAITQDKKGFFNEQAIRDLHIPQQYIDDEVEQQSTEAQRRLRVYRGNKAPQDFTDKHVILVDDGIATGYTMKAAISSIKSHNPKSITIAVPVAPAKSLREFTNVVDDIVCVATPHPFGAVGSFYKNFDQTEDEEVVMFMGLPTIPLVEQAN